MLTRLRVKGFKSLEDVEVRFGPFTCIAGANGAGKSNLFDAIVFLKNLANTSIIEAASAIRNGGPPWPPAGWSARAPALRRPRSRVRAAGEPAA